MVLLVDATRIGSLLAKGLKNSDGMVGRQNIVGI
jgi:hypothetical protein